MKSTFLVSIVLLSSAIVYGQKSELKSPCLWVNTAQIAEIKKYTNKTSLKKIGYETLIKQADKYLKEPLDIPQQGGNWEQYYISPVTTNVLQRGN